MARARPFSLRSRYCASRVRASRHTGVPLSWLA